MHVKGCWRPNINFIFWPHCYDRHVVSFLFSWCWGLLHRGFPRSPSVGCGLPYHIWSLAVWNYTGNCIGGFRGPLGRVWPSLPHLVSNPLGVCWQLHRGFPRSPSDGCGLPYHISSLTLWESAGNCIGGFPSAPSVGRGFPYHIWSLAVWKSAGTASGVSKNPLGRVWSSLPHLVSTVWNSTDNCSGTQTQLS